MLVKSIFNGLIMCCLFIVPLNAQENNWKNYFKSEEVRIDYRYQDCISSANGTAKQYVLFKINNETDQPLELTYQRVMWYNDKCLGCDNGTEYTVVLELAPDEQVTGTCEDKNKALKIFSKMLNREASELDKFELRSINAKRSAE